jgi:predicted MPP superfamily phosphohydrolase
MTFWKVLGVLAAWNALCWLVIGALLAPGIPGGAVAVVSAALLALAPVVPMARSMLGRRYPSASMRRLVFRPFWYVQLLLPILTAIALVAVLVGLPFGSAGEAGRLAIVSATAVYIVLILWGYVGSRRLVVRPLELRFEALPAGLDGLRIVQISDLHVGPHTSRRHLERIAAATAAARPHLIALTGDQVDDYAGDTEPFARAFAGLDAPLGVHAIAGNHDIYAGWSGVRAGLEAAGINVLVNEAIEVAHNDASFWLAGTGDPAATAVSLRASEAAPNIDRTLGAIPDDAFVVALAHNPVLWPALAERGVELTLSGHTHHGQFSIPRLGWSLASPFLEHSMDLHRRDGSLLYVNPGTNYWGIPFRIGALPEITVVTLRRGRDAD